MHGGRIEALKFIFVLGDETAAGAVLAGGGHGFALRRLSVANKVLGKVRVGTSIRSLSIRSVRVISSNTDVKYGGCQWDA